MNSLTLEIRWNVCLNRLRKERLHNPHHEVMFNKTCCTLNNLTYLLGWNGPKEHVQTDDWCSDFLIINSSLTGQFLPPKKLTVLLWPLLCLCICKFQHLLYNLAMSCTYSGFTSHLIAWLWYAVGVSVGCNCTRCWQRQTASTAAGPYVVYRAPSLSPGPAPYTKTVHSPRPGVERGIDGTRWSRHVLTC